MVRSISICCASAFHEADSYKVGFLSLRAFTLVSAREGFAVDNHLWLAFLIVYYKTSILLVRLELDVSMISLTELGHFYEIEIRSFGVWSGKNACFYY